MNEIKIMGICWMLEVGALELGALEVAGWSLETGNLELASKPAKNC